MENANKHAKSVKTEIVKPQQNQSLVQEVKTLIMKIWVEVYQVQRESRNQWTKEAQSSVPHLATMENV
jgi:ribosomal protein S20